MNADDARGIRASARRIGLLVGLSSALIIAVGIGSLVWLIAAGARPERRPAPDAGESGHRVDHVVVDVDKVLPGVIIFGILAVILLGFIAWAVARWAVLPLGETLRLQRNFIADASHELRTPLAALVSRTQILDRRNAKGEPLDDVIVKLRRDAETMSDVLTDLLTAAAAADAGGTQESAVSLVARPGPVIAQVIERLEPIAASQSVRLDHRCDAAGAAAMPEATLVRACTALVDNAVAHSPAGGVVTVTCSDAGEHIAIRVEDQGPGIAEADRGRVFERFARGAGAVEDSGFGLGLALVQDIAVRVGGSVRIERSSAEGTVFLLLVPRVS